MAIYRIDDNAFVPVSETTFAAAGLKEREDIQRRIRAPPSPSASSRSAFRPETRWLFDVTAACKLLGFRAPSHVHAMANTSEFGA